MNNAVEKLADGSLILTISQQIYSKEAVLATAYKFTNRVHIIIAPVDSEKITAHFQKKGDEPLEKIAGEFSNELIDQQIREKLRADTSNLREVIVKKAFSPIGSE